MTSQTLAKATGDNYVSQEVFIHHLWMMFSFLIKPGVKQELGKIIQEQSCLMRAPQSSHCLLDSGTGRSTQWQGPWKRPSCALLSHRIVEVRRALMRAFNPNPLPKLGQLKQVSNDCVQVHFQYLHGSECLG